MLIDTTPVGREGALAVLAEHTTVHWRDGSRCDVHQVSRDDDGIVHTHLRAIRRPAAAAGAWLVFDLRHLAPDLAADLCSAHWQDASGLVYYSLRLAWAGAQEFIGAVLQVQLRGVAA